MCINSLFNTKRPLHTCVTSTTVGSLQRVYSLFFGYADYLRLSSINRDYPALQKRAGSCLGRQISHMYVPASLY